MSVSDERTIEKITADRLLQGDRIAEVVRGEMGDTPRFTVQRMVERAEGWYVVTEAYRGRERALYWGRGAWRENPTGQQVDVDERNAKNVRLSA